VRPVVALDPSFGLRRARRDDLNPQGRTHATKLRPRHSPRGLLLRIRHAHIDILPVGVEREGHTDWPVPNYTRVHAIVTNPFLAGAYVYGRSETRTAIVDGRIRRTPSHALAVDQWQVVIPDHHPGYLDWASYRRHLSMIESNTYMKPGARKSARGGRSLLAGLLRCRGCGHTLQVCYSGRPARARSFAVCVAITRQGRRRACPSPASRWKTP
jgi:hypothetical protein